MPKGIRWILLPVLELNATPRRVKHRIDPPGRWHLTVVSLALLSLFVSPSPLLATEFLYDNLDRLERAIYSDGRAIGYSYDNVGNRLSREEVMVSVSSSPGGSSDVGTTVTVQASVLGGSGAPHEFQFWRKRGASDPYLLVRDFGVGDNVVWNTGPETNTLAETYRWRINGRRPGSTLAYETFGEASYTLTVPAGGYYTAQYWGTSADNVVIGDFDGDGKTDIAVYRPSSGVWFILQSTDGYDQSLYKAYVWGVPADIPVPGDYDGDGKTDIAVYRPSTGVWYILQSTDGYEKSMYKVYVWGVSTDIPIPGDYDGDGKTDLAVWRPGNGNWRVKKSSDNGEMVTPWGSGTQGDMPVPGDFDGDGKADLAVYRSSSGVWFILLSTDGYNPNLYKAYSLGASTDIHVRGDYDGDGKTDIAVYRPSSGIWYILRSSDGYEKSLCKSYQWGDATDIPVPGDYDGDGKTDPAVWRPSIGVRFMRFL